jgi:hypothetical protein
VPPFHSFYEAHIFVGFSCVIKLEHFGGYGTSVSKNCNADCRLPNAEWKFKGPTAAPWAFP